MANTLVAARTAYGVSGSVAAVAASNCSSETCNVKPLYFKKRGRLNGVLRGSALTPHTLSPARTRNLRKTFAARSEAVAGGSNDETSSGNKLAPVKAVSPVGQLLSTLLEDHPHLFATAADQQLETLAADREASQEKTSTSGSGSDLVLYRRMAEVRAQERTKAVEEVMYAMVVHKFIESGAPMMTSLPAIPAPTGPFQPRGTEFPDFTPAKRKLEAVHTPEALEMVAEHLEMVLGLPKGHPVSEADTYVPVSKMRAGQVYAASMMYGYFLRKVDQRFQLEKNMKAIAGALGGAKNSEPSRHPENLGDVEFADGVSLAAEANAAAAAMAARKANGVRSTDGTEAQVGKMSRLRQYVESFDKETLQRYATIGPKVNAQIMNGQVEALFGKPKISVINDGVGVIEGDEVVIITVAGLRRVLLEAVAFGSFLWDVEAHVDSRYSLMSQ